jgi:hypothetical protein
MCLHPEWGVQPPRFFPRSVGIVQDAQLFLACAGDSCSNTSFRYVTAIDHGKYTTLTKAIAIPSEERSSKRAVGSWDDAYTKASAALAKLSQDEKIGIVTGVGWSKANCVGNTKAASSIGYPSLCLQGQ